MAYYSGSGQTIRQGAAGLGRYFQGEAPPVHAFRSGVLSGLGEFMSWAPGTEVPTVQSFRDGILGSDSRNWSTIPGEGKAGALMAYKDGSLGQYEQAAAGLGRFQQAAAGIGATYEQAAAGIGYPLYMDGQLVQRPMTLYHGPARGMRGVPHGPLMSYRDGVLGAAVDGAVLNLQDPAAIRELKMLLYLFGAGTAEGESGPVEVTEDFFASPIWGAKATELWKRVQSRAPQLQLAEASITKNGASYPSATAIAYMMMLTQQTMPDQLQHYPLLSQWADNAGKATDPKEVQVTEPFFTEAEKVRGKGVLFAGMQGKTLAMVGLAGAAAIGAFVVFRKKRR